MIDKDSLITSVFHQMGDFLVGMKIPLTWPMTFWIALIKPVLISLIKINMIRVYLNVYKDQKIVHLV